MNNYPLALKKLEEILDKNEILVDEPMRNHTYFEIGGTADIIAIPNTIEKLISVIKLMKEEEVPLFLIGNGSNLLVKDGGIRGCVLKTEAIKKISCDGERLTAECGALLKDISDAALDASLGGFEFACGIPGTLGGAVFMNAGAYDGEMSFVLESARVLTRDLEVVTLKNGDLEMGYRTSAVKENGYVVLEAVLKLVTGDREAIKAKIDDLTERRNERQPLEYPSAGSTFKRPPGYYAGKLIQDAGLKGYQIGGAQVSEKHSGFVINKDHASAKDVIDLINHIKKTVDSKFGVELNTEILIVGEELRDIS
ncbi:UDP-N-acetylmuramate dehydrogenase [Youngiibacter multivorans]|jgi:UDP-N-acetylmuramate dehydrogenase|uniref:UDP-N-acetylenolpyruvoylglucosamine reductase n=1 Tax=Youngiibacter multivorans TaxID=937251 RepID=A0ABS4G593_9CLOT|nr:UDP-N-acetylmuramate dehydrogenase [Youngiibacter multivorans]MBP1919706.1 UDP-N-acetylmuramate dehydrogenase [Youngiibacter multivorans]